MRRNIIPKASEAMLCHHAGHARGLPVDAGARLRPAARRDPRSGSGDLPGAHAAVPRGEAGSRRRRPRAAAGSPPSCCARARRDDRDLGRDDARDAARRRPSSRRRSISAEVIDLATLSPDRSRHDPRFGRPDRPTGDRARGGAQRAASARRSPRSWPNTACTTCWRRFGASPATTRSCPSSRWSTTTFRASRGSSTPFNRRWPSRNRAHMATFKLPDLGEGLQEAEIVALARHGRRPRRRRSADGVGGDRQGGRRGAGAARRVGLRAARQPPATSCRPARR